MGYTLEVYPTLCLSAFFFFGHHADSISTGADERFAQWFAGAQLERPAIQHMYHESLRKPANHLSDVDALVNQETVSVIKRFNQTAVASDVQ